MTDGELELAQGSPETDPDLDDQEARDSITYAPPPPVLPLLTLAAVGAHNTVRGSEPTRDHVVVRVTPSAEAARPLEARPKDVPRANIAVVIDRSGSMDGTPLEQAKRACSGLLDLLAPQDLITVVSYADTAEVILPARPVTHRALMRESLGRIKSGSTTNLLRALEAAGRQLLSVKDCRTVNRIYLVTDGEPTAGVKEFAAIMAEASDLAARGVVISTFGLGTDYEEDLLAGIAQRSGGNYYHVPEPSLIAAAFEREYELTSTVVARSLRLRLRPSRDVSVLRVFGHDSVYGPRSVDVTLSDLEQGASLQVICELEFGQRRPARYRVLTAELLYDDRGTLRPERLATELSYQFVEDEAIQTEAPDPETARAVEIASAIQTLDMTILAIRRQNMESAEVRTRLQGMEGSLRDAGCAAEAALIGEAISAIDRGVPISKVLMSTVFDLNQGKTR